MEVQFYNIGDIQDSLLKYAVIVSEYCGQWVFCKHKQRDTYEIPGGHRESDEDILAAGKRELYEETGAVEFEIEPVCVYSVKTESESFGMLYYAQIKELGPLPETEIGAVSLFYDMPLALTYPLIQPKLMDKVLEYKHLRSL